jgi:serpin B
MVPMMRVDIERDYVRGDGYQALSLPYISPEVQMLIVMPDEGRMDEIEAGIDGSFFDEVRNALSLYQLDLKVPRFSFDASFELQPALAGLGMTRAFGAQADLSGIAGAPGQLSIGQFYHQAFISVDESGTEAAAATSAVAQLSSAPPRAELVLDRPFIFAIFDEPTGQILFLGRLSEPN